MTATTLRRARRSPAGQVAIAVFLAMSLYLAGPSVIGALASESNPDVLCSELVEDTGIVGTVSSAGLEIPIAGAFVAILRTDDFSIAAGPSTNLAGEFQAVVEPGQYYVYLVDPKGHHPAGFVGAPDVVEVTDGNIEQVDGEMTPTRGVVAGTVTQEGSGDPIPSAMAVSIGGPNWDPELLRVADGGGEYLLPGLAPGSHFVALIDPEGGHSPRFWPNSPNVPDATPVAVSAGQVSVADAALPFKAATPTGAEITGTVTDAVNGEPIPFGAVFALNAADYQIVRGGFTDAVGNYSLDVVPGDYKVVFIDSRGTHEMEWYDDLDKTQLGDAVTVTAPGVADAELNPTTGSIVGVVSDETTEEGIACAWAIAIGPSGIAGGALTDENGLYRIDGLTPGNYKASFVDPQGGRLQEYWQDSPDYQGGSTFAVVPGGLTPVYEDLTFPAAE